MALMRLGPVLGNGGGAIGHMAACMAGYAHPTMEDLDSRGGGAYLYLLLGELIRHAVPVMIKGHVIIDIDAMGLPIAVLVALCGQGTQHRFIKQFKLASAGALTLAEWPVIQPDEQLRNRLVELSQREELPLPQDGQDPTFRQQPARFHPRLVAGFQRSRWPFGDSIL